MGRTVIHIVRCVLLPADMQIAFSNITQPYSYYTYKWEMKVTPREIDKVLEIAVLIIPHLKTNCCKNSSGEDLMMI